MNNLDELGVGLVYFRGFERFLASHSSLIDVVEVEPQTFWYDRDDECNAFKYDTEITDFLKSLKRPKIFHGVGYPIGGTCPASRRHFNTLRQQANQLQPQWISEHLNFNIFNQAGRRVNSGFLLPPLQSKEGIKTAVSNIRHYQSEMNRPFAFETSANYLKPRKNEIPDGLFMSSVAEEADCCILLDLHNILANQRNGRQSVREFMEQVPLERVIELHVGGGFYYKNYYLDAHSGPSDAELLSILEKVVRSLPNLKALLFEIDPESFTKVSNMAISNQLITMRHIWDKRGYHYKKKRERSLSIAEQHFEATISVSEWERTLGKLVLGKQPENDLAKELLRDKGVTIIKDMVFNFRGSLLISMLKMTTRLLRLWTGEAAFNKYVADFFDSAYPELLPVIVAEQFSDFMKAHEIAVPHLEKVLEYELALIHTAIDKQQRSIVFGFDPAPLFAALENAQLPTEPLTEKIVVIQVNSDQPSLKNDALNFNPVVHN